MGDDDEEEFPVFDPGAAPGSIEDYSDKVRILFWEIQDRFGRAEALRIFSVYTKPDRPIPKHELKKQEVLELYYTMTPWGNKLALAHELTEGNKKQPGRYGKGSTDVHTMRTYIDRAVKEFERRSANLRLLLDRTKGNTKPKPKPK